MLILTPGYSAIKLISNSLLGKQSQYINTPPTFDEVESGLAGANAAFFGIDLPIVQNNYGSNCK
jgi:hypothetical protein